MDQKRKEELNDRIEEIFDNSFSSGSAWEKIKKLADEEGEQEVYLTLLENILDDLIENADQVKAYLRQIGWELPQESDKDGEGEEPKERRGEE